MAKANEVYLEPATGGDPGDSGFRSVVLGPRVALFAVTRQNGSASFPLARVAHAAFVESVDRDATVRGDGGFGST
jgi:hypothetical protein